MTGRIPSAEYKVWVCSADDCSSVQPQLQQYFCWTNTNGEDRNSPLKIRPFLFIKINVSWKKNEYSKVTLSLEAQEALQQMHAVLTARHYSPRTIRNYTQEMRFLFAHYFDRLPQSIVSKDIVAYINYIVKEHEVGREKCHPRTMGRGGSVLQFLF